MVLLLALACSEYNLFGNRKEPRDTQVVEPVDTEAEPIDSLDSEPPASCPEQPSSELPAVSIDAECVAEAQVGSFSPHVEWAFEDLFTPLGDPSSIYCYDTPVVLDLTEDGVPDILFATYLTDDFAEGWLRLVSGDGSKQHWALSTVTVGGRDWRIAGPAGLAVGDLEGDGSPDIVTMTEDGAVLALEADGTPKWVNEDDWTGTTWDYQIVQPAIADMDGDGLAEVVVGRLIIGHDGTTRAVGSGNPGGGLQMGVESLYVWVSSFPVDLDLDGTMEVVAGDTLYAIDGSVLVQGSEGDGLSAAGNFDLDPEGEWVTTRWEDSSVTLYDTDGSTIWSVSHPGQRGGAPTVADFDGDGLPEVGVAGRSAYAVFDTDGSVLWSQPITDLSSSRTGSSVFDFEGDGRAEVVFADEVAFTIFDGTTGDIRFQLSEHSHGTSLEYPVIADVDGDGATEILLASWNHTLGTPWNGVRVIGDLNESWAPARPLWNQYAYSITHVEDDGSIPANPPVNWATYNSFRAAAGDHPGHWRSDLVIGEVELCTEECDDHVEAWIPVGNAGLATSEPTVLSLSTSDGLQLIEVVLDVPVPSLQPGASVWIGPLELPSWEGYVLVASLPEDQDCDATSNRASLLGWPCD